jgi:hypothetical protein
MFSVRRLGYDEAKRQAEAARLEHDAPEIGGVHSCSQPEAEQPHSMVNTKRSRPADAQQQTPTTSKKRARPADTSMGEPRPALTGHKQPASTMATNPVLPQSTVSGVYWESIPRVWSATWIDVDSGTRHRA